MRLNPARNWQHVRGVIVVAAVAFVSLVLLPRCGASRLTRTIEGEFTDVSLELAWHITNVLHVTVGANSQAIVRRGLPAEPDTTTIDLLRQIVAAEISQNPHAFVAVTADDDARFADVYGVLAASLAAKPRQVVLNPPALTEISTWQHWALPMDGRLLIVVQ